VRVLVTGGAGFIGSHVVDRLVAAGHRARILDLVPSPYQSAETVEQIVGDLRDRATVRRAVAGCDAVMHLAAVADVDQVAKDPATADVVNVRCTQTLLDCVREQQTRRFVFASTIWVYGDASDPTPIEEGAPVGLPKHFYTATKLAGEMYTASYGALYGLEWTILRFGIPYGPRGRPTAVVPAFTAKALAGRPLTIAGDGTQVRRFIYVEDLADGCVAALAPIAANRVYNLVGDETTSVRAIARTIRDIVGMVPIEHVEGRVGDLHGGNVSGERAARELGWRATTIFADGVRRYVDWVTAEEGTPNAAIAASTDGSAATVARHDPGAP
jgi:UDP-glucose 4-epimerase